MGRTAEQFASSPVPNGVQRKKSDKKDLPDE